MSYRQLAEGTCQGLPGRLTSAVLLSIIEARFDNQPGPTGDIAVTRTLCIPLVLSYSLISSALFCNGAVAADWPQFLGPNRNGISKEMGLLKSWPVGGLKAVWRVTGGAGMSGIAVSGGKLATMVQRGGKQQVLLLNAKTGKTVWDSPVATAYRNSMGQGPRATPTIDHGTIYAFTGEGILAALNMTDGKIIWQHDVVGEMGGKTADYGMASSPLIVGNLVVVTAGAPGATVVAYEKSAGKIAWKSGNDTAGYSSASLLTAGGKKQIVAFTGKSAWGLHPISGNQLWRFLYETDFDCNIATPLQWRGKVFISAGENHGSTLLALKPDGEQFVVETAWASTGRGSVLRNEWQTSILLGNYLYGMDNVGGAGPITHLTCVSIADGKRVWQQRRFGKGNMIAADGKLFISTLDGELAIVAASSKAFHEIGREKILRSTRQAPALADGLLYLRDDQKILCIDVRARPNQ